MNAAYAVDGALAAPITTAAINMCLVAWPIVVPLGY